MLRARENPSQANQAKPIGKPAADPHSRAVRRCPGSAAAAHPAEAWALMASPPGRCNDRPVAPWPPSYNPWRLMVFKSAASHQAGGMSHPSGAFRGGTSEALSPPLLSRKAATTRPRAAQRRPAGRRRRRAGEKTGNERKKREAQLGPDFGVIVDARRRGRTRYSGLLRCERELEWTTRPSGRARESDTRTATWDDEEVERRYCARRF